jgi:hypothetical protein
LGEARRGGKYGGEVYLPKNETGEVLEGYNSSLERNYLPSKPKGGNRG